MAENNNYRWTLEAGFYWIYCKADKTIQLLQNMATKTVGIFSIHYVIVLYCIVLYMVYLIGTDMNHVGCTTIQHPSIIAFIALANFQCPSLGGPFELSEAFATSTNCEYVDFRALSKPWHILATILSGTIYIEDL